MCMSRGKLDVVLAQAGFDPVKAAVRLNWGSPEVPEVVVADILKAAELGLIRMEEFRKNAVKFGWELWEQQPEETETEVNASGSGKEGGAS